MNTVSQEANNPSEKITGRKRTELLPAARAELLNSFVQLRRSLADFPTTKTQADFLRDSAFLSVLDLLEIRLEELHFLEDSSRDGDL